MNVVEHFCLVAVAPLVSNDSHNEYLSRKILEMKILFATGNSETSAQDQML